MNGGGDGVDSSNARVSIVDGIDWYYRQSRVFQFNGACLKT